MSDVGGFVSHHPFWTVGGVAAAALLIWVFAGHRSATAPQAFNFSYGPSDTQVRAGTALAISQAQNQTEISRSNIQAGVLGDYFDMLAGNKVSDNATTMALGRQLSAIKLGLGQDAVQVAGIQSATALGTAGFAVQAVGINANRDKAIAETNSFRDRQIAGVTQQTLQQGNALLAQTSQQAALLAAQTAQFGISSDERLGAATLSQKSLMQASAERIANAGYAVQSATVASQERVSAATLANQHATSVATLANQYSMAQASNAVQVAQIASHERIVANAQAHGWAVV